MRYHKSYEVANGCPEKVGVFALVGVFPLDDLDFTYDFTVLLDSWAVVSNIRLLGGRGSPVVRMHDGGG